MYLRDFDVMIAATRASATTATKLAGLALHTCLFNSASPVATSEPQLSVLAGCPSTGAVTFRTSLMGGFPHSNVLHKWAHVDPAASTINCLGYSPHLFTDYVSMIPDVRRVGGKDKPLILSVTGSQEEVATMITTACKLPADLKPSAFEVNLSCPNIPGAPAIAYDPGLLGSYVDSIDAALGAAAAPIPVGVKLTPYLWDAQFVAAARVLNASRHVRFVTSCNTLGHGLAVDIESQSAVLPATYGGLGGSCLHQLALGNVHRLRTLLDPKIDIVGVGGVADGAAAFRMLLCGANAVQVGSACLYEAPEVLFPRIVGELLDIMAGKGYTCLEDFQGKLRVR